jgi:glycogen debranching enzyme
MKFYLILFLSTISITFSQNIDDLGIQITGDGRQYVFTNKEAGTYHGEVNGPNSGGWQGWFINAEKIFHDYTLTINNSPLDRSTSRSIVFPHQLIRNYSNGIKETVTFVDSIDVLLITVNDPFAQISITPTDNFKLDSSKASDYQHWIRTHSASEIVPTNIIVVRRVQRTATIFAIAAGRNIDGIFETANYALSQFEKLITQRKDRMQKILDRSPLKTNVQELTIAIAWAKLQIDALIMCQSTGGARTKGIFAGLPWFNNYWGRDSFISLPGATYVIGNFSDAREILRSYAAFQEQDSSNSNYGRIPNLATPQSVVYNTADGTPWFVKSLYEYIKYSGDIDFIHEFYPVIVRSINGTSKFHCDSLGFLTHGDAESWMDAVGPNGPWSPRGNRACDIQTLWYQQLMIGIYCAEFFNDFHNAATWKTIADTLERNFKKYFIDTKNLLIYDHLKPDGSSSSELRPNQLFSIDMTIPEAVRQNIVLTVLKELVYEYGTSTLSQSDSNFHPFHEYSPYYVKDAAYHTGTVWTWLNGIAIYAATRYDLQDIIFPVTKNSVRQILHRGTVGALSELLDAHPRRNGNFNAISPAPKINTGILAGYDEPSLSGTYSQAWSLAEFIRSIYQDYCGVSVDIPSKVIRIQPKLPKEINTVEFVQRVGKGSIGIKYYRNKALVTVTITPKNLTEKFGIDYIWVYENGDAVIAPVDLIPDQTLTIEHSHTTLKVLNGKKMILEEKNNPKIFLKNFSDKKYFAKASLATPEIDRQFPVLQGPSYPLLSHEQIKKTNANASLLYQQSDPVGDDAGLKGTYLYPTSQHFKKGILDITNASFHYDEKNLYCSLSFADLYSPGWHQEYGFQLTLAAIMVNTGNGKQRNVDANSRFILDSLHAYNRIIFVGGGVRILNENGKILCDYIPKEGDVVNPIGSTKKKSIEFALPLEYLGTPNSDWRITILVGAQDDHGGAGIGEFRTVQKEASEWLGGGKNDPNDPNVYDVMIVH